MPVTSRRIVKEALLVGVSYATNDNLKDNDFPPQPGAHKDTLALRRLLTSKYGYEEKDITTLVDSEEVPHESWPTKENILRAMKDLIADKQAGDHIVFAFSGHGGQVKALVESEEIDGMDEILLPVDCTVDPTSLDNYFVNFIRDDEIRDIFVNQLDAGVRCTLIFDCCHSGTASDLPSVESPIATTPGSPLFGSISPRSTGARAPGSFAQLETLHDGHANGADSAPYLWPGARAASISYFEKAVTSWSACLDDQLTFGRKSGGIFVKAFTHALELNPAPTHGELLQSLRTSLIKVIEDVNRRHVVSSRGDTLWSACVPPRPQLGSLCPKTILQTQFTL
ncbi:peptidase C14 [Dichomitus squalens LYAD-421 SS1]|uniref:Peptidase C14 n=1 Tax=Dichomitus squalens (strain LYAD-421) TaxID=732165 RepID=R7SQA3_DICSQ|nr:peptidase C14 [Dichomitus squalens LYAD-421 SS1]EJF57935.1 peptidase C14 [Dichomitus squalens LYAD-421 SS1]